MSTQRVCSIFSALLVVALLMSCTGLRNPQVTSSSAPSVLMVVPQTNGVGTNRAISVVFSTAMDPASINSSTFVVAGVPGTVSYDATNRIGAFKSSADYVPNTTYHATITVGAREIGGTPLAAPFNFSFVTRLTTDTSLPVIVAVNLAAGATCVPLDQKIKVTFDEQMDSLTINSSTLFIQGVAATVTYDVVGQVATITPTAALAPNTTFTLTVTTGAKDMGEQPLAAGLNQTFTTGPCQTGGAPHVTAAIPAAGATCVPLNQQVKVAFDEAMDPITINATTVFIEGVNGAVVYDAATHTATITPAANLAANTTFTITVTTAVRNTAGVLLAAAFHQTFITGPCASGVPPIVLCPGIGNFSVLAGSTVTNTGSSVISGDVGVSPGTAVTGFPPGTTGGIIHSADGAAGQAQTTLTAAYIDAAGRAGGTAVAGDLVGRTLTSGVYTATSSLAVSGDLTLDAQGNPDAVFIFQIGSTLTTGSGSHILLANGAKACNIFWQVGSSATLGTNSVFKGNILALTSITITTGVNLEGRALARNGAVTLDTNVIGGCSCQ